MIDGPGGKNERIAMDHHWINISPFSLWLPLWIGPEAPLKNPGICKPGKKFYEQNCLSYHGAKGDGKGPTGAVLKPPPQDLNIPVNRFISS